MTAYPLGTVKVLLPRRCSKACQFRQYVIGDAVICTARDTGTGTVGDIAPGDGDECLHVGREIVKLADSGAPAFYGRVAP